jgi:hypothetical protein
MAGADADLDAVAFALAHPAEHGHDQFVGLVVRVDRAAHLRGDVYMTPDLQRHRQSRMTVAFVWFTPGAPALTWPARLTADASYELNGWKRTRKRSRIGGRPR